MPEAKIAPHDLEAERAVLGGILLYGDRISEVVETLEPRFFYLPKHERIYTVMLSLFKQGIPIDYILVRAELEKRGWLGGTDGKVYLSELAMDVSAVTNIRYYAQLVEDRYRVRQVMDASGMVYDKVSGDPISGEKASEILQRAAADVAIERVQRKLSPISDVTLEAVESAEAIAAGIKKTPGIPTGFIELDKRTQGLHPGELIIVGARPSVGKTSLMLDIARNVAQQNTGVLIFSIEMSKTELGNRLVAAQTPISLKSLRAGQISPQTRYAIHEAQEQLAQMPIYIDESPRLRPIELLAKARLACAQFKIQLIMVDYIQLMEYPKKSENRQQEMTAISRSLKAIARELNVTLVAFSQLTRASEQQNRRPRLSDLRETGSLEQDADLVLFLHNPEMHSKSKSEKPNIPIQCILAKQRNGPTGTFMLMFQRAFTSFKNAAEGEQERLPDWVTNETED